MLHFQNNYLLILCTCFLTSVLLLVFLWRFPIWFFQVQLHGVELSFAFWILCLERFFLENDVLRRSDLQLAQDFEGFLLQLLMSQVYLLHSWVIISSSNSITIAASKPSNQSTCCSYLRQINFQTKTSNASCSLSHASFPSRWKRWRIPCKSWVVELVQDVLLGQEFWWSWKSLHVHLSSLSLFGLDCFLRSCWRFWCLCWNHCCSNRLVWDGHGWCLLIRLVLLRKDVQLIHAVHWMSSSLSSLVFSCFLYYLVFDQLQYLLSWI